MTNIAMENPNHKWRFIAGKIIYKWAMASIAMLNNQRVVITGSKSKDNTDTFRTPRSAALRAANTRVSSYVSYVLLGVGFHERSYSNPATPKKREQ